MGPGHLGGWGGEGALKDRQPLGRDMGWSSALGASLAGLGIPAARTAQL